jgi:hypothetical protein
MKEEAPEILVKAVRNVARGETGWLSNRVAEKLEKYNTVFVTEEVKHSRSAN